MDLLSKVLYANIEMFIRRIIDEQSGNALILALIAVILVGIIAAATFSRASFSEERSGQARQKDKSELAAETAMGIAIREVQRQGSAYSTEDAVTCSILDGPRVDKDHEDFKAGKYKPYYADEASPDSNFCLPTPAPEKESWRSFINGVNTSDGEYSFVVRGGGNSGNETTLFPEGEDGDSAPSCGWPGVPTTDAFPATAPVENRTDGRVIRQITAYGFYNGKCARRVLRFMIVPRAFRYAIYSGKTLKVEDKSSVFAPPAYKSADQARGGDIAANETITVDDTASINNRLEKNFFLYDQRFKKNFNANDDYTESSPAKFYGDNFVPWGTIGVPRGAGITYGTQNALEGNPPFNGTGDNKFNFSSTMALSNRAALPEYSNLLSELNGDINDNIRYRKLFVTEYKNAGEVIQYGALGSLRYGVKISPEHLMCLLQTVKDTNGATPTRTNCPALGSGYHDKALPNDAGNNGGFLPESDSARSNPSNPTGSILPAGITVEDGVVRVGYKTVNIGGKTTRMPQMLLVEKGVEPTCTVNINSNLFVYGSVVFNQCDVNISKNFGIDVKKLMYQDTSITHTWPGLLVHNGNLDIGGFEHTGGEEVPAGQIIQDGERRTTKIDGLLLADKITVDSPTRVRQLKGREGGNLDVDGAIVSKDEIEIKGNATVVAQWNQLVQKTVFDPSNNNMGTYSIRTKDTADPDKPVVTIKEDTKPESPITSTEVPPIAWDITNSANAETIASVDAVECQLAERVGMFSEVNSDIWVDCNTPEKMYILDQLKPGRSYTFRVRACNVSGCSVDSTSWYIRPDLPTFTLIANPTGQAMGGNSSKNITWVLDDGVVLPPTESKVRCALDPANNDPNTAGWVDCSTINFDPNNLENPTTLSPNNRTFQSSVIGFGQHRFRVVICNNVNVPATTQCTSQEHAWNVVPNAPSGAFTSGPSGEVNNPNPSSTDPNQTISQTAGWTWNNNSTADLPTDVYCQYERKIDPNTYWSVVQSFTKANCPQTATGTWNRNFETCGEHRLSIRGTNNGGEATIVRTWRNKCRIPQLAWNSAGDPTSLSLNVPYAEVNSRLHWKLKSGSATAGSTANDCEVSRSASSAIEGVVPAIGAVSWTWNCANVGGNLPGNLGEGFWNGTNGQGLFGNPYGCQTTRYNIRVRNESGWSNTISIEVKRACAPPTWYNMTGREYTSYGPYALTSLYHIPVEFTNYLTESVYVGMHTVLAPDNIVWNGAPTGSVYCGYNVTSPHTNWAAGYRAAINSASQAGCRGHFYGYPSVSDYWYNGNAWTGGRVTHDARGAQGVPSPAGIWTMNWALRAKNYDNTANVCTTHVVHFHGLWAVTYHPFLPQTC